VLSSLIWICTTTNNNTKVVIIDANKPDIVLETFHISCQAHIGCIASVPGKYNLFLCFKSMKNIYYICYIAKSLCKRCKHNQLNVIITFTIIMFYNIL